MNLNKKIFIIGSIFYSVALVSCGGNDENLTSIQSEDEAKMVAEIYTSTLDTFILPLSRFGENIKSSEEKNRNNLKQLILNTLQKSLKIKKLQESPFDKLSDTKDCAVSGSYSYNLQITGINAVSGDFVFDNCDTGDSLYNGTITAFIRDFDGDENPEEFNITFKKDFTIQNPKGTLKFPDEFELNITGDTPDSENNIKEIFGENGISTKAYFVFDGGPIEYTKDSDKEYVSFSNLELWINSVDPQNADVEFKIDGKLKSSNNVCSSNNFKIKVKTIKTFKTYTDSCPYQGEVDLNNGNVNISFYSPDSDLHNPNNIKVKFNGTEIYNDNCLNLKNLPCPNQQ